jgi:hypothetical protein
MEYLRLSENGEGKGGVTLIGLIRISNERVQVFRGLGFGAHFAANGRWKYMSGGAVLVALSQSLNHGLERLQMSPGRRLRLKDRY